MTIKKHTITVKIKTKNNSKPWIKEFLNLLTEKNTLFTSKELNEYFRQYRNLIKL